MTPNPNEILESSGSTALAEDPRVSLDDMRSNMLATSQILMKDTEVAQQLTLAPM